MDIYKTDWKAKAKSDCEACKGYGLLRYRCRPEGCFDYGIEIGPCTKCLYEDFSVWKKENSSLFAW